ncbi:MAG: S9 family peptidase [Bacteroidota bacterium]
MKSILQSIIFYAFSLTIMLVPNKAKAQQNLTIEKLWQLGRVGDPQVSPDGKTVLYGVRHYSVKTNKSTQLIYTIQIDGSNKQTLTDSAINAFAARYTPDGKKISFLSAKGGETQLWEMSIDGSNKTQVTFIKGGISGYKYSPKMNNIAFTADVKLDKEVKEVYPDLDKCNARIIDGLFYRHWDTWHDYAYSHLFIAAYANGKITGDGLDIMKDEKFDCPLQPHGDDDEFNWHPDGTKLVYNSRKLTGTAEAVSTNSDVYLYDLSTQQTLNLSLMNQGYDRNAQFSADGKKIYWLSVEREGDESDLNRLIYFDLDLLLNSKDKSMSIAPLRVLTDKNNFDYTIENYQIAANGKAVYFTAPYHGSKQLFVYDLAAKKGVNPVKQISTGVHDYGAFCVAGEGNNTRLVINRMDISTPSELYTLELKTQKETQLTFANQSILNDTKMGKVEKRMVKTSDGKDLLSWVIYPPDFDATKKYPTLLYCQGGPQSALTQFFSYRWNFQLMAANGYIVIAPNRRGMPGYGSEWNDQITGDYGGQCMRDYLSAIDDISKETYVNKDKLGAVGASFGGFSVYWLAGNHNKRFKAFIAHCGMFNMESWYGTTEEMFFANHDSKGPYWSQTESPNNFDASPHKFVKNWDTPILVIHNEKDFRVPLGQGMEAFTAAQLKGVPSRFLYFPDENHWVTKPQNSVLWQRVFFEWLDKYLN